MKRLRGLLFLGLVCLAVGAGSCGSGDKPVATARELVERSGFAGVRSGELEVGVEFHNPRADEELFTRLLGSFVGAGEEDPPQLDMALQSEGSLAGRKIQFSAGLLLLKEGLVLFDNGPTYQPDPQTFDRLATRFREAQKEGDAGNAMACAEAAEGVEVSRLIGGWKKEGSERAGSDQMRLVSGELNVPGLIEALTEVSEDPACGAQLQALGLPVGDRLASVGATVERAVGRASVQFAVDQHHVLRSISVELKVHGASAESSQVRFNFRLNRVNEVSELPASSGSRPFVDLLREYGLDLAAARKADGTEAFLGLLRAAGRGLTGS